MSARRVAALAGLGLGLVIALAANLTYAVPRGPVTIGLGLIAPLVLPVALYIRTTFEVSGFWHTLLREAATLAVAGPAAAISYVHTYELVLSVHEPTILALLAPLSSDGLAGMATLALHQIRKEEKPKPAAQKQRPTAPKPATEPVPAVKSTPAPDDLAPKRIERDQSRRDQGKEWARKNWPVTGGEIAAEVGVGRSEGDRIRAAVKAEREAAS